MVMPHVRGHLLDIGCGSNGLRRRHGRGVGVDVHPWDGVDVVVDDTAHLPFATGSFDTVAIVAALNHIPNRGAVLDECRRVLRADGQLVLTMLGPVVSRIWHWLRAPWDADQRDRGMKAGEVFGIARAELLALCREHGFECQLQRSFMLGFNRLYVFRPDPAWMLAGSDLASDARADALATTHAQLASASGA